MMHNILFILIAPLISLLSSKSYSKGQPSEWQISFQDAASPLMQNLIDLHDFVFWIITFITIFVFFLLAYVCIKFSAKNNKKPTTTTHNSLLEVAWTVIPVLLLVVIAIPSFKLLYNQNDFSKIDMTIKATGYTWYWGYEYPDHDSITFDSFMLTEDELEEGQPRLLSTDNQLVVPVNTNIKMQITSDPAGVIHSWAVPSLGVKMDAIPGRLNETYFNLIYGSLMDEKERFSRKIILQFNSNDPSCCGYPYAENFVGLTNKMGYDLNLNIKSRLIDSNYHKIDLENLYKLF